MSLSEYSPHHEGVGARGNVRGRSTYMASSGAWPALIHQTHG